MSGIAVIAAHPDDEALGCGGTLLKFKALGAEIHLMFLTDGCGARINLNKESKKNREDGINRAISFIKPTSLKALSLPDNQLDTVPLLSIVHEVESFLIAASPEVVFTHYSEDLNIDHCITNRAALTATRPGCLDSLKEVYAFEVPSSTEWAFSQKSFFPDTFVDISDYLDKKMDYLECYKEEMREFPSPRSFKNVKALNQVRGASVCVPYAEGFKTIRRKELNFDLQK